MKSVSVLILYLLMTSAGISQNSNSPLPSSSDSALLIPTTQLRKAIFLIEQGKLCEQEVVAMERIIKNLETQNAIKDTIITRMRRNERDYSTVIKYYKDMAGNYEEITKNLDANIKIHQKEIKRQKFNRYLYAIVGIGVGIFIAK